MTFSEGQGPAYITPFNCSICQNRIGNMVTHSQEYAKEIYDLLLLKETGIMCVSCIEAYSNRKGFNNDVQEKLK